VQGADLLRTHGGYYDTVVSHGWPLGERSQVAWRLNVVMLYVPLKGWKGIAYAKYFTELCHCITIGHMTLGIGQVFVP